CVKINAFLKQTLGFRNTFRLKGGIVSYARDVQARRSSGSGNNDDMSTFRGVNYVFDDRMGSRVTDDVLAACEMCGSACDSFHNCRNTSCS
ncbi:trhO, partial [Symbiodinium microadriaticum]